MNNILIKYWNSHLHYDVPFKNNENFEHSDKKVIEIINVVIEHGYSTMLLSTGTTLIIWVGRGVFRNQKEIKHEETIT